MSPHCEQKRWLNIRATNGDHIIFRWSRSGNDYGRDLCRISRIHTYVRSTNSPFSFFSPANIQRNMREDPGNGCVATGTPAVLVSRDSYRDKIFLPPTQALFQPLSVSEY
jgi:hypothetical protein